MPRPSIAGPFLTPADRLIADLTALHTNLGRCCEDAESAMAVAEADSDEYRLAMSVRDESMASRRRVAEALAAYGAQPD